MLDRLTGTPVAVRHPGETRSSWCAASAAITARVLSRKSSDHIISLMKGQLVNTKYGAVIPREHLANKTGELADVSHDSGYITLPGREVALTTTTAFTGIPRSEADKFVQQTATIVYEFTKRELPGDRGKRPAHSYTTGKSSGAGPSAACAPSSTRRSKTLCTH
jgi:beta-lactamase class A